MSIPPIRDCSGQVKNSPRLPFCFEILTNPALMQPHLLVVISSEALRNPKNLAQVPKWRTIMLLGNLAVF
jgi:hypothetical protein